MISYKVAKPVLAQPIKPDSENSVVLDYVFFSGLEKTKNRVIVKYPEYLEILHRISEDKSLVDAIITRWRKYASLLAEHGKDAEPPIGNYHASFMQACDPQDAHRGALIAAVFGEQIESDLLHKYIADHRPPWSSEFSVKKSGGEQ